MAVTINWSKGKGKTAILSGSAHVPGHVPDIWKRRWERGLLFFSSSLAHDREQSSELRFVNIGLVNSYAAASDRLVRQLCVSRRRRPFRNVSRNTLCVASRLASLWTVVVVRTRRRRRGRDPETAAADPERPTPSCATSQVRGTEW